MLLNIAANSSIASTKAIDSGGQALAGHREDNALSGEGLQTQD
jgi:hypothetical protein